MSRSRPYRIIYMGTPEFAVAPLQALLDHGEEVAAVVCQPDRPKGRGKKLSPPPTKELAEHKGIPVLQPSKIRTDEFLDEIRSYQPDLLVVAAYGRILPGPLLNLPPLGTINIHGSLLPAYRGAAPIQWAIINGEAETGVTIMQMDEGMDTGDILLQRRMPIHDDDTSGSLAARMSALGGQALVEALELLKADQLPPIKQDDTQATMAPLLCKTMADIDWKLPATKISCLIRGLDPWPLARTTLEGQILRLFKPATASEPAGAPPGTITMLQPENNLLGIATGEGCLLVEEIQREGGKRLPIGAFHRGHPLKLGQKLGT
ncbi:methionyl-tRNA formyltransferase [Desulfurivibrio alkaliphilus]|uniref:Methionyl-tRNA formyltransferase n=1 Tax=Desulfurivibrio alkaliphilus (strain DSM 19089 / UNIQEM U267 / AHT2) TaxID=589865 RepID=D6YZR3_DESAT|nr:methionyl-tRNA formyltransferase [Desulfurivibrio alkaliphilus]ADH85070.1 methionyl-tRNA formyltransferase [Desulfurivibrio alkaliphilus AHT 2]